MASTSSLSLSKRPEKSSRLLDLRHKIAYRRLAGLRRVYISIIGDEGTGRRTLLRRFLNLKDPPFQHPENWEGKSRDILVDVGERPQVIGRGFVFMHFSLFNHQEFGSEAILETVAQANSFAVVFDVARNSTFVAAEDCMVKVNELLGSKTPEFILVGNKADQPEREVSEERGQELAKICKAARYYECSGLMNINIDSVLDALLVIGLDQFIPLPR